MRRLLKRCLCWALVLPAACSAEPPPQNSPPSPQINATTTNAPPCHIPADALKNLPDQVLAGTDLTPVATFAPAAKATVFNAGYTMDMGGATVSVSCVKSSEKGSAAGTLVSCTREFREPGMPADAKPYSDLCFSNNLFYGEHIRARLVDEGLLWLELDAGNDFIPSDFWLFLK